MNLCLKRATAQRINREEACLSRRGTSPIGANLRVSVRVGHTGEASSPLLYGVSIGTMPCRSGELASPSVLCMPRSAFRSRLWGQALSLLMLLRPRPSEYVKSDTIRVGTSITILYPYSCISINVQESSIVRDVSSTHVHEVLFDHVIHLK